MLELEDKLAAINIAKVGKTVTLYKPRARHSS